jgi:hypothetical protein
MLLAKAFAMMQRDGNIPISQVFFFSFGNANKSGESKISWRRLGLNVGRNLVDWELLGSVEAFWSRSECRKDVGGLGTVGRC